MKNKRIAITALCAAQIVFFVLIALLYLYILRDTLIIDDGHFTPMAWQLCAFMEAGLVLPLASWIVIIISQKRMKESGEMLTSSRAAIISMVFYCLCTTLLPVHDPLPYLQRRGIRHNVRHKIRDIGVGRSKHIFGIHILHDLHTHVHLPDRSDSSAVQAV